jgi:hypothetical protein
MSTLTRDPASDEISRLGHHPKMPSRVILGTTDPDTPTLTGRPSPVSLGVELTDAEYAEYVRLAGNEFKIKGLGLHEALNKLVASPVYTT